jgi:hypothetical protein
MSPQNATGTFCLFALWEISFLAGLTLQGLKYDNRESPVGVDTT